MVSFVSIYRRNGKGRARLKMRPNRYLNKKRSSDKVLDKIGDMGKITCQQKRSFDKVRDNVRDKYLFIPLSSVGFCFIPLNLLNIRPNLLDIPLYIDRVAFGLLNLPLSL